jgi:hypothetical protein
MRRDHFKGDWAKLILDEWAKGPEKTDLPRLVKQLGEGPLEAASFR